MTSQVYFENTGQLHQVEATWKLVIKIDVLAIDARFLQLEDYHKQTQKLCEKIHENIQSTCQNVIQVIEKRYRETKVINRTLEYPIPNT